MAKLAKRMYTIYKTINKNKEYDINEAFFLLKEVSSANFIESVDVAINLGIDTRKSEQNIRGTTLLPNGTGRFVRIVAFAQGQNAEAARAAGADMIGMEDLADQIKKSTKIDFDVVIATPDSVHIVSQLGKILGPRGLMPNLKMGTITSNIYETIKNTKIGQIRYRNDKNGIIHSTIGKVNFEVDKLKENLEALLISLKKEKPAQVKGIYIKKISISTTMGGGISINQTSLNSAIY